MSGFAPIVFSFFVSIGVVLQLEVHSSTSDQGSNYPLLFSTSLNFFLASIQLPLLLLTNSTMSLCPIMVLVANNLSFVTMITSFTTLMLAFPTFGEVPYWGIFWAIFSGIICFAISVLYKLIGKTLLPGYGHCLHVAFLTLCVAFAGLYTDPLLFLPDTIQYDSIINGMNFLYHFILVPVTFVLGTILVIFGIASPAGLVLPVFAVPLKEGVIVLALAVGLTTLIIGASLTVYAAFVNLVIAGGIKVGGPGGPNHVEAM